MAQASTARKKAPAAPKAPPSPRRQRLMRDIAMIVIAPLLLYLFVCLVTYSPTDPGWSHSGSVTAPLRNAGGHVGAWLADVLLYLCGYVAFVLPLILGLIAWIALFGMDSDGDGDADLGPALRLVGIVGFLVAATGLLHLRWGVAADLSAGSGGILGRLVGNSLLTGFGPVGGNLFLLALLLISVMVFALIRLIPGDAVTIMLGANTEITPDRIAELRATDNIDSGVKIFLPEQ